MNFANPGSTFSADKPSHLLSSSITPTPSSTLTMECANCQEPATLVCGACRRSPVLEGDAPIVHYCNAACQRADWAEHKPKCQDLKDRMILYRVAYIAQKLFLLHRELTWGQLDVQRVEKSGDNLFLRGEVSATFITIPKHHVT
jgi:hypothetical protein